VGRGVVMTAWEHELEVATSAAQAAGSVIREAFGAEKRVNLKKNASDLVTETDVKVAVGRGGRGECCSDRSGGCLQGQRTM
jgi:hypothetical protein